MARVLCLWLPRWPIQRLCAQNRAWVGRPLVVHALDRRNVSRVVCCSTAAERLGITVGMPLSEATAQLELARCGGLPVGIKRWSSREDRMALEELAVFCGQFSPLVGHTTQSALGLWTLADGLFLEVSGTRHWFGGEERLVAQAMQAIADRWGYRACWAVADTLGAAWAWARYGPRSATRDPTGACLSAVDSWSQLKSLPIAALRLEPSIEQEFELLGIERIEQVAALPAASLTARWGALPAQRLAQLRGQLEERILPVKPPRRWQVEHSWEHPTALRQQVERIVWRLMEQLAQRLVQERLGALELQICLRGQATGCYWPIKIVFFEPTACVDHWQQLARMQFEQTPLPAAVTGVVIEAIRTAPLSVQEGRLFGQTWQDMDRSRALVRLVDRLSARLGPQAVLEPRVTSDRQPEYAQEARPYLDRTTEARTPCVCGPLPTTARPLWLYQPPLPVEVMAVVPEGPPLRCRTARFQFTVARCWGPERIETGWWRGPSVRRDYYRVEAEDGRHFWIFRRLTDGHWFLQGEFT